MSLFDLFRSKHNEPEIDITPSPQELLRAKETTEAQYEAAKKFVEKYYRSDSHKQKFTDRFYETKCEYAEPENNITEPAGSVPNDYDSGVRFSCTSGSGSDSGFFIQHDDLLEDVESSTLDFMEYLYSNQKYSQDLIRKLMRESFSEQTRKYMLEKGLTSAEVYKKAQLDKSTFSKILSLPEYSPTKDTAIAVCLGLTLDLKETKCLLTKAGYTLSASILRDVIVKFCIETHMYDVISVNCLLEQFNCRPLGRG